MICCNSYFFIVIWFIFFNSQYIFLLNGVQSQLASFNLELYIVVKEIIGLVQCVLNVKMAEVLVVLVFYPFM